MKTPKHFLLIILLTLAANAFADNEKTMTGWVEKILLPSENITMDAKLDTGAFFSSINADNIHLFQKANKAWVEFDITNSEGILKHVTYPLIKYITIKRRDDELAALRKQKRPLIAMKVCLGHQTKTIKVDLIGREQFIYAFLFGREDMKRFNILIDPSKKNLVVSKCD